MRCAACNYPGDGVLIPGGAGVAACGPGVIGRQDKEYSQYAGKKNGVNKNGKKEKSLGTR